MSFAWTLYDRIIDLSDAFANHFNNLLALDFQEETVQVGQDANQGQWRQVERGRRTRREDLQADQARRESLAQKLTLDTAPNMDVHAALFKDLLAFQFSSPGKYGLDELWDGTQLNGNVLIFMLGSADIHLYFMNWKALIPRQATSGR